MKICIIADTHLFSSEIGGNWPEDSFIVFKDKILPKVKNEKPDAVIFLGDILDPHSGKSDPRWPKGDEASGKFVKAIKEAGIKNTYALRGNHDYVEPLKIISEMNKILLMHENLSIKGADNIPKDVMKEVCRRFDMIFNGHQHVYDKPYNNVWCLSSALPWRPGYGNCDVEIIWESGESEPEINENEGKFGFYLVDIERRHVEFIPVDIGLKIIIAKLYFSNASATEVRDRLIKLSELLAEKFDTERSILRVYLEGTLKEGDERIDVGFSDIESRYYSSFYEGRSRKILRVENLKGGGAYLSKDDLRYISVEDALKHLEAEIPKIRDFYKEVSDLIEKKTFDGDALIERIRKSKALEDVK